jgi:hypothetical protein
LDSAELASQFGPQSDDRFRQQLQRISERLLQLPSYRNTGIALER